MSFTQRERGGQPIADLVEDVANFATRVTYELSAGPPLS